MAVASVATAKALTISLSGLWVVGPNDRLQASLRGDEGRVILAGGDTLLAMAPALAVVALGREPSSKRVVALTLAAVSAVAGLLVSGTRTSFLVAMILLPLAVAWRFAPAVAPRRLALVCSIVILGLAGLGYAGGVLNRLPTEDAPHVGVNFRLEEAEAVLDMPAERLLLGQGLGGRFTGKDVNGQPVTTGWAHSIPLWLLLKGASCSRSELSSSASFLRVPLSNIAILKLSQERCSALCWCWGSSCCL